MDENSTQQTAQKSSMSKILIPAVVIGLLVIAAIAYFVMNQSNVASVTPEATVQTTTAPTEAVQSETTDALSAASYSDGEYTATGSYVSPGGPREVEVTVTLENNVITDAEFVGHATDPNSKRFQGEFRDNFKPLVEGKNIDEVSLTKVAGSSLSPKGFMEALEKIKTEAEA